MFFSSKFLNKGTFSLKANKAKRTKFDATISVKLIAPAVSALITAMPMVVNK
jgi:hypothetical protein